MASRPPRPPQDVPELSSARANNYNHDTCVDDNDSYTYHNIETRHHVIAIDKMQPEQQPVGVVNDKDDHEDQDDSIHKPCSRTFKLTIASNMLFVMAAFLYVLLAAYDLEYARVLLSGNQIASDDDDDAIAAVVASDDTAADDDDDDDAVAVGLATFASNGTMAPTTTDRGGLATFATKGTMAPSPTDGGYPAAMDDEYGSGGNTLAPAGANEDDDYYLFATKSGVWVSRYQIVYFVAALCFVLSGGLDFIHKPWWILSLIFILAGICGLVSAMLVEEYEYLSEVFNSISVHLFMVEAVGLFLHHRHAEILAKDGATATWPKQQQVLMSRLHCLVRWGDVSFITGTCMDVILSYSYVRGTGETIPISIVGVVSANLWLLCSLIYLMATCITEWQVRKNKPVVDKTHETSSDDSSSDDKDTAMPDHVVNI
jgi:hypothetical protein